MKKMVMVLLAVVMLLGLVTACGEASQEEIDEYIDSIIGRQGEMFTEVTIVSDTVQSVLGEQIEYLEKGQIENSLGVGPFIAKSDFWIEQLWEMDNLLEGFENELEELEKNTPKQCKNLLELWEMQIDKYRLIIEHVKRPDVFEVEAISILTGLIEDFAEGITDMNVEIDKLLEE